MSSKRLKSIVSLLSSGYTAEDILKKQPLTTPEDIQSAITSMKKTTFFPPIKAETPAERKDREKRPIPERNEIIATRLEDLVNTAVTSFKSEEIVALTPRERILLISTFTEKMRLLRGESTENIATDNLIGIIEKISK